MACNKIFDFDSISSKCVLRYFIAEDEFKLFSYDQLRNDSNKLADLLKKQRKSAEYQQNIIIFLTTHSPALLPTIVATTNVGDACCFVEPSIDYNQLIGKCAQFQTDLILCDKQTSSNISPNYNPLAECDLFEETCYLVQVKGQNTPSLCRNIDITKSDPFNSSKVFFYASTSGSCGETKSIGVTYKCFMSNVRGLAKIYKVTENDVIFVSSPPTFDPFMVDICLALQSGACLVMADNKLRCDPSALLNALFPHSSSKNKNPHITLMQTTPSLFMRWTAHDIKSRIFSSVSSMRLLAFGGEPFPITSSIVEWFEWRMPRLFNLYGLTEMSCWASIYEVSKDDLIRKTNIPIGSPIDEYTTIDIDTQNGELLLKSTIRKCFQPQLSDAQVIDDNFEFVLHTGDIVEKRDDFIYFKSRSNSVIKLFGQKLDMGQIEDIVKEAGDDEVIDSICLFDEHQNAINLFIRSVTTTSEQLKNRLSILIHHKIKAYVKIHILNKFPITSHGKVDRNALLSLVQQQNGPIKTIEYAAIQIFNEILGLDLKRFDNSSDETNQKKLKTIHDASFIFLGGSSLKAIQIVDEIERMTSSTMSKLLPMLLDEHVPMREILEQLSQHEFIVENPKPVDIPEIVPCWSIDMIKCIDATPTICTMPSGELLISVGSHSKYLYNISIASGEIISKIGLPDRIECQVTQFGTCGIVGCYDGYLYCFDIATGEVKWKFNSGGMIKSRPIVIDTMIIFGNYNDNHNIWCLNADDGMLVWHNRIGTKSIFANLLQFIEHNVIVCTLDGVVALVDVRTSKIVWPFSTQTPIFSTPVIVDREPLKFIIVAGVDGNIFGLSATGSVVWTYSIEGNIFSSFDSFQLDVNAQHTYIIFGSQNKSLYCLEIDAGVRICKERWKYATNASIRATPLYAEYEKEKFIVNCSSDGSIQFVKADSGDVIYQRRINGALFSAPVISKDNLFIASRNNKIYCIDLGGIFKKKI